MSNGVHYCSETATYNVWVSGAVIAGSADQALANLIYITHVQRERLKPFPASVQWMVAGYGD